MTLNNIVHSWIMGRPASTSNGSFSTDGVTVWSYQTPIAWHRSCEEGIFVLDFRGANAISTTTSRHVGLVLSLASNVTLMDPNQDEVIQAQNGRSASPRGAHLSSEDEVANILKRCQPSLF